MQKIEIIESIRKKYTSGRVRFSIHSMKRMDERKISLSEIEGVILTGEIVEEYPKDIPCPSYLIMGYVRGHEPLYVLAGLGEKLTIITVHWQDPEKWLDAGRRKKGDA